MAQAIGITRHELSATALRQQAARCRDGRVACRMLAIAHILDGATRTEAAAACGMERQTLRDWVHRYNAAGMAGLRDARRSGRPAALSEGQMAELRALVLAGPDLAPTLAPTWPRMVWCVGVASICARQSRCASMSRCMSGRWASCCGGWT